MAFSIHDYEILGEAGSGGFGTVLRARQKSLNRTVAIKCLSPRRMQRSDDILRFKREAHAMAALSHDNVVQIFDYAFHGGSYYIVMEYVDGLTLEKALAGGIEVPVALHVMERAAAGLAWAHEAGIVHRDIKPANILLGRSGQVKLADFGLATIRQDISLQSAAAAATGTISYMAPEAMVSPKEVDRRADIFSLGCVLYQVVAGRLPFPGASIGEVSYRIINEEPAVCDVAGPYAPVRDMAMRCMAKDRDRRPGLREVQAVLTAVVPDCGAGARELMIAFLGNGRSGATAGAARPPRPGRPRPAAAARRSAASIAAVAAIAAGTVLVCASVMFVNRQRAHYRLPAVTIPEPVAPPAGTAPGGAGRSAIARGGPAPMTGEAMEMNVGTVLIRGVMAGDTFIINGKPMAPAARRGAMGLPVSPGRTSVDIKGSDGMRLSRTFDIMPYQVVEWTIRAARSGHGRPAGR